MLSLLSASANATALETATNGAEISVTQHQPHVKPKDYIPMVLPFPGPKDKNWKSPERYDFTYIDGLRETYAPGEKAVLSVEGKSDKVYVDKESGFELGGTILNLSDNTGKRADITYDSDRRRWLVKFIAPADSTKDFDLILTLFCQKNDSQCAAAHGYGTQVQKIIPIKLHQ